MSIEPVPQTPPALHVGSDVEVLERVVVHRPGSELARVTDATAAELLFDGPVDVRRAERDHDQLVEALAAGGAHVEYAEDLLASAAVDPARREALIRRMCRPERAEREALRALPAPALARALLQGVPAGGGRDGWAVRPLPNLIFTRDLFALVGPEAVHGRMRHPARRPEAAVTDAILAAVGVPAGGCVADVEGGDVLQLGDGVAVIGIGERTSAAGAARAARHLLESGAAREIIGAHVPAGGPFHLDLALTLVDHETLLADRAVVDGLRTTSWTATEAPGPRSQPGPPLVEAIARALGRSVRVVGACGGTHDRRWDRGANVVALRPGTVVAYADNAPTNRRLERAGIEVIPIPGRNLGRGRGGPRCLTAPLLRSPATGPAYPPRARPARGRATEEGA